MLSLGIDGQVRDLDAGGQCKQTVRGIWAGGDESRVLDSLVALHGQDEFSQLQRVPRQKNPVPVWLLPLAGGSAPVREDFPPPCRRSCSA